MRGDLLSRVRAEIESRLDELRPSVHEYERLLAGGEALAGDAGARPRPRVPASAAGRPRLRGPASSAGRPRPRAPAEATAQTPLDSEARPVGRSSGSGSKQGRRPSASRRSGGRRGSAAGTLGRVSSRSSARATEDAPAALPPAERERAPRNGTQQAIIAALEHGSHTVAELTVVTAISAASIRGDLRRLVKAGSVAPAKRDGKAAYALRSSSAS